MKKIMLSLIMLLTASQIMAKEVKEIVIYSYDYGDDESNEQEAEELYSGKYDVTVEEPYRFLIIPEENGYLTVQGYSAVSCTINLYSKNGKLLKKGSYVRPLEFKVKKNHKYYLHVIARNEYCKYIDVFVPGK